jgi:CNT family concentrative nucleoside transporter
MDSVLQILRAALGIGAILGICLLFSTHRRAVDWRLVGGGVLLQVLLALLILRVPGADAPVEWVARGFVALLGFTDAGSRFVFGFLSEGSAFWEGVNAALADGAGEAPLARFGLIFAFRVLPTVIFFSALTSVLYYLGVLQKVVLAFAWLLQRSMRLSGAESLAAAANIFIGQTEAPLVVKPFVGAMNRSELLCLMTGGMATIAGGVFGAYVAILGGPDPAQQALFAKHLLTASLLSAPAAIVCAKLLVPQTESVDHELRVPRERMGDNVFDAACQGTTQGMLLCLNIGAMLITFLAFIALFNYMLEGFGSLCGLDGWIDRVTDGRFNSLRLELVAGVLFAPVAWLIGVEWGSLLEVGQLLGIKLVANEFVAYESLGQMLRSGSLADPRAVLIATYALCGFANFASMGIQIGGISVIAPEQRGTLAALALRALLGGTAACLLTAAIAALCIG